MFRKIIIFVLIAIPVFAKDAPNFNSLKKTWGRINSLTITKNSGYKYSAAVKKGNTRASRDIYMIVPDKPELLLWFFHGYKPEGDPYKQSPDLLITNMGLAELSSWYNALVVIVDSGTSLYRYYPENELPELQIYSEIYDRLIINYGILPAILAGISSGAEGAVKFAPFVQKLNSLIGISGTYNFNALALDSGEYKIHLKEYGSADEWKYEQPLRIFPLLKCNTVLLSEEKSIYLQQAMAVAQTMTAAQSSVKKKIEFIGTIGKGKSHDWDFWGSEEVKKIIQREIQAAGEHN